MVINPVICYISSLVLDSDISVLTFRCLSRGDMIDIKALQQQQTGRCEDLMVTGLSLRWEAREKKAREKMKSNAEAQ